MLIAIIDNYDSFTFNLVHYILNAGADVEVFRNDSISNDELKALNLDAIVISPGPGRPEHAGISLDVVKCFSGINKTFTAMRDHSLAVARENFPDCLIITSKTEDEEIMGFRHREHPTCGVLFHPEPFMTDPGKKLIKNFISNTKKYHRTRMLSPG